jgi:UDP-glucuronate decarboxylase
MLELAEKIISITGSKSTIVFEPLPEDDPRKRKPDILMAQKILGWAPRVSLEDGIKMTADYFMRELRI